MVELAPSQSRAWTGQHLTSGLLGRSSRHHIEAHY
jgi:hypothetical protein